MTTASALEYRNRFRGSVAQMARAALSSSREPHSEDMAAAAARYTRWFHGETISPERNPYEKRRLRKIDPDMTASEIAAVTEENMTILGEDTGNIFLAKLPVGHHMRKAIRASVVPTVPHLGTCKFGEILLPRDEDHFNVTQVFLANFNGLLDSSNPAEFCKPLTADFDQMYYGVHIVIDKYGNTLGIDRRRGRDGIAFKTKDITKALYSIASASTGLSFGQLHARATLARR